MADIRKPAVKILQGKRSLFLTSLTVRDFSDDFYRVDRLDVQEDEGMQRLLNNARVKSFSRDILGATNKNEAFLPTSVFLATSGKINYDEKTRELFFDSNHSHKVCPLDVVDGQHRIEGLKKAARENKALLDFPVATIIATDMSEPEKMLQFVTVNTKQQTVDRGVAQHIIARFTRMLETEELPYLPSWIQKKAERGDDARALKIAKALNTYIDSPWKGRIQFADEEKNNKHHTIRQTTFVTSVKHTLLARNHPLSHFPEDKQLSILLNYWKAIREIFVTSDDGGKRAAVCFKYTGLEFFHSISGQVINMLSKNRRYSVAAMKECIKSAEEHLDPEAIKMMSPKFWDVGQEAGELNASGRYKLVTAFANALAKANSDDIEV